MDLPGDFSYLSSTVSIGFSLGLSPVVIAGEINTILTGMGDTFDKVRGNALISIPADIRWQKMSGWRLDFGGEETRIIMKNE